MAEERSRAQSPGTNCVPTKLALIQSLWRSGSKSRSTAPAVRRDKTDEAQTPGHPMRGEWPPHSRHPGRELGGAQPSEAKPSQAKPSQAKPKGCVPNWLSRRCHCKGPFLNHEPWRSAFGQTVAWTRWLRDWPAGMWCEEIINKPALMQASGQNLRWGRERRRLRMSASEAAAGGKNLGY